MKRPLFLLTMALFLFVNGCYNAKIQTELDPSLIKIEEPFANAWIFGLVPPKKLKTEEECKHGVSKVETKVTFLNGLVTAITLGVYSPMFIEVTCATTPGSNL